MSIKERLKEKTIEAKKLQEEYMELMQEAIKKGLNPEKIQREIADEMNEGAKVINMNGK